jgi:YHS domain-containing protein
MRTSSLRFLRPRLAALFGALFFTARIFAASRVAEYNLPADKLALQGYDPVAYFEQGQAVKGSADLETVHATIRYRFASEAHRTAFTNAPAKYLPTYGGWCATAMAKGDKVEIDPTNFKITGGRLFLFYNGFWGNARKDWNKDEPALTKKADAAWKKLSGE